MLPPGPGRRATFAVLRGLYRDALGTLEGLQATHGDLVRFPLAGEQVWLASHPDHVGHVLRDNYKNYTKGAIYDEVRPLLGEGLVTAEGERWKRQRRLAQPAFHPRNLEAFAAVAEDEAWRMVGPWRDGEVRDLATDAAAMAFRVACRTLFGSEADVDLALAQHHFTEVMRAAVDRSRQVVKLPLGVPTPTNRRYTRSLAWLEDLVYGLIARRRGQGARPDLLGLLLSAVDEETGATLDDEALRDEGLSFLFAGHETTANTLAWALHLLAAHPDEQARVHDEAARLDGPPGWADVPRLPYTRRVLDETLRLYPPAWWLERQAIADDTLPAIDDRGPWPVPAGTRVVLSTWLTHRHEAFWDEPGRFDPDRFLPARAEGRHRTAYYPFAVGPRACIGASFALTTLTIVLGALARGWRFHGVPARPVRLEPLIAVRSGTGVHLRLEAR